MVTAQLVVAEMVLLLLHTRASTPANAFISTPAISTPALKRQLATVTRLNMPRSAMHTLRQFRRERIPLSAGMQGISVDVVEKGSGYEIRKASLRVGGLGRSFLRSRDILQALYDERQGQFDREILQPLDNLLKEIAPMEQQLAEAKKKYDEAENEVFGSQIRPLEVKLKPLLERRTLMLKDKSHGESVMTAIGDCIARSKELFVSQGVTNVLVGGLENPIQVEAGRQIGMSPDSEISWQLTASDKEGISLQGKWPQAAQLKLPDQPLVVDLHGVSSFTGGDLEGLVVSLPGPEEGTKKLCAVAEWNGALDSSDVMKRLEELLIKTYMDGLIARRDQALGPRLTTTPHKSGLPLLRRNELWLPVKPPRGKRWLDHLTKVATDLPAKNATFYSLKDSPYTWYSAWGEVTFESNLREKAADTLKPTVRLPGVAGSGLGWQFGGNLMDPNTFLVTAPAPILGKEMLAVDHSSSGELAVSRLRIQGASELEEEYTGTYAVAKIAGSWPITSQLVHTARMALVGELEATAYGPPDDRSFRLLIKAAGDAELWLKVFRR